MSTGHGQAGPDWDPGVPGVFSRTFRFGEWIAEPVTPLFESWLLNAMEERLHELHLAEFGMRAPRPRHVVVNGWYFYSLNFLPVSWSGFRRSAPTLVAALVRNPRRSSIWIGPLARHGAPIVEREWRGDVAPRYAAAVRGAEATVDTLDPLALVALVDALARLAGEYFSSITVVAGSAYKAEMELARFYGRHLAPRIGGDHLPLVTGLTEPVPAPAHAVSTIDWWRPTLGELRAATPTRPSVSHARLVDQRVAAEGAARAALQSSRRRLRTFDRLLADAQRPARAREEQVPAFTLPWPAMRRAVARLGEALVASGVIGSPDDAFFLTRQELVKAVAGARPPGLAEEIRARRASRDEAARLAAPMSVGTPPYLVRKLIMDGRAFLGARPAGSRTLVVGVPASPGRVTARVRVIREVDGATLEPREVLVAPLTAPAWTPLFASAAAVVTDVGSAAAHASVIAREYGIPAVVGTGNATSVLHDGQLVTVDGGAGLVEAATDDATDDAPDA